MSAVGADEDGLELITVAIFEGLSSHGSKSCALKNAFRTSASSASIAILCDSNEYSHYSQLHVHFGIYTTVNSASGVGDAVYTVDQATFHKEADELLDLLSESVEHYLDDNCPGLDYDVRLEDGVLTVDLGEKGTYVLNKQNPNRQIWWSSPLSGPKRFQYNRATGHWESVRGDGFILTNLLLLEFNESLFAENETALQL